MPWQMRRLTGIAGVSPDPDVNERISAVNSAPAGLARYCRRGRQFSFDALAGGDGRDARDPSEKAASTGDNQGLSYEGC